MSVLLVNPPSVSPAPGGGTESFIRGQKRRLTPGQYYSLPVEHLGIMSIAASARVRGIEVATVNGMVEGHADVAETWHAIRAAVRQGDEPSVIGFSNIDTFSEVLWLAERCRTQWPDVKIVLGNVFATLNFREVLIRHGCFDFVVIGEGEHTFVELAEAVLAGRDPAGTPGLAWRESDGAVRSTAPAVLNLDELPWPARDELQPVLREGFAAAVYSTRGCLYRCTFCGTGAVADLFGRDRYRARTVENVVDEIEYLVRDFGLEFVSVSDDLFLAKHPSMQERAGRFADEILRRGLRVAFMVDGRIDAITDLGLMARLERAGLRRVFVGLETGSYEQLVAYRKRQVPSGADVARRIEAVQELGIEVIPGTIMFHPEVRPAELRATLELIRATGYTAPRKLTDRITAYAGTELHRQYAAKGLLTQEWPIGEWEFADPHAKLLYARICEHLDRNEEITFDRAAELFLAELGNWEAVEHGAGHPADLALGMETPMQPDAV